MSLVTIGRIWCFDTFGAFLSVFCGISTRIGGDYVSPFVPVVISKSFISTLCALTQNSIATSQDEHTSVQRGTQLKQQQCRERLSQSHGHGGFHSESCSTWPSHACRLLALQEARADLMHRREPCQKGITHINPAQGRQRGHL